METLKKLSEQILKIVGKLTIRQRLIGGTVIFGVLMLLMYVVFADHTDYVPLFSGMSEKDAAAITESLTKDKVPFRLAAGGATILVPSEEVHKTRLSLAGRGLPRGGGVGYEIFDAQKFGISDFAQQINYRRALQGELERTISQMDPVDSARVHIAMPRRQMFARQQKKVSAAVTIRLHPGRVLSPAQTKAVVHLVSSSVTGLASDQVTVVDTSGAMLWGGREGAFAGGTPLEYKTTIEDSLERRVAELLSAAVGQGRAVVKVTADVAMAQIEQTDEQFDPEQSALRSESKSEEKSGSPAPAAKGVPGVRGNLPGGPGAQSSTTAANSSRKQQTRNFEVNRTVRKQISNGPVLKRLSVAVLVDERALTPSAEQVAAAAAAGAKKEGGDKGSKDGEKKVDEASDKTKSAAVDLAGLEQIVQQAVGFNKDRGDIVTLKTVRFAQDLSPQMPSSTLFGRALQNRTTWLVAGAAVVLALFAILLVRRRRAVADAAVITHPTSVKELEAGAEVEHEDDDGDDQDDLREIAETSMQARQLAMAAADQDAVRAAQVLRAWMSGA